MKKQKILIPSVKCDILKSILISTIIISFLFIVFELYGSAQKIDSRVTSLFGAILAFSGLMTKQYLLKENIEYLHKWKKIKSTIDKILLTKNNQPDLVENILIQLENQNNLASCYMNYIVTEIKIIPIIPLLLVVLCGVALIASESPYFSLACLSLMLLLVSYLAEATITSNNLAIDTSNIDELANEFDEILVQLNNLPKDESIATKAKPNETL